MNENGFPPRRCHGPDTVRDTGGLLQKKSFNMF